MLEDQVNKLVIFNFLSLFDEIPGESLIVFKSQVLISGIGHGHFYAVFSTGICAHNSRISPDVMVARVL